MKVYEYQDFNEAFYEFNRKVLTEPIVEYLNTTMGGMSQVMVKVKSSKCDKIDLGKLGYSPRKWDHLIKNYLGSDKIDELKNMGVGVSGLSTGMDFLRKTIGNGACMREIVINREKRKKPWTSITVIWRTTELQRRWAADLILIHRMMELIPNSEFKEINLYMVSAYQSAMYIIPFMESIFGIKREQLAVSSYHKVITTREDKYFKPEVSPHKMLDSGERLVELYKEIKAGKVLDSLTVRDLKL